mmetsp:Transcript_21683/g.29790  ORF Transcript_21683/g.29790 Transcript_21683/m.29790 type:complete len:198 (-) Transcript_21683:98-691(-)|eukprot:CAMPEP_0201490406 /NCGR_PEP_ID=MMETSP0151_2-20130828/26536_1 /ASSEMBLY_ACC=CAM_ASM_000257 /TAXON_ID=200890 /ORGANISM="Paramoeba atlantica, Strain 621/1 / CCAP 1560/9" /LENGTH=197 /DNA_ID=CAMNT_0047876369 /DNA_START=105 /DNA_END=698 /DNA_ORIENTATION=+
MACHGCGAQIGDADRFCQGCGMPQNPKKKEGTKLDATKFGPPSGGSSGGGGGGGGAPSSSSASSSSGGGVSGSSPAGSSARGVIVGVYEYVKPAEKNVQTLVLEADGSVKYSEVGETGMEKWDSKGHGSWKIVSSANGDVVQVILAELTKNMVFKIKTNVKGIEDGSNTQYNVGLPIFYKDLAEAKQHGAHKWRRKS